MAAYPSTKVGQRCEPTQCPVRDALTQRSIGSLPLRRRAPAPVGLVVLDAALGPAAIEPQRAPIGLELAARGTSARLEALGAALVRVPFDDCGFCGVADVRAAVWRVAVQASVATRSTVIVKRSEVSRRILLSPWATVERRATPGR